MEKIKVLEDTCIGCRACAAIVEEVFKINEQGFAEVIMDQIPEELKEDVQDAMDGCPTGAIIEDTTKEDVQDN